MRPLRILPCLVMAALLSGCDGQPVEPVPDEAITPSLKVTREDFVYTIDLGLDPPFFVECVNDGVGELFKGHGTIDWILRVTTNPSGNEIWSCKIDYDTDTPPWADGLTTGDVWTFDNGEDNCGRVYKPKGTSFVKHWQFNEFYSNQDGERLHIRGKGQMMIDADGNVKIDRVDYSFKCHG